MKERTFTEPAGSFFQNLNYNHPWMILWIKRILIYLGLYGLCLISWIEVSKFILGFSNLDNARTFLGTIIPCQAGIIAIVITLTLVVVQINSASYSSRLVEYVIKKNPDFWILLIIYLGSIGYGLSLLMTLTQVNAQDYLSSIFLFAIFSYLSLIPYLYRTLDLINSRYLLLQLSNELSDEAILTENSSFQLIFDILKSSISRNDFSTVQSGLFILQSRMTSIISKMDDKEKFIKITDNYCNFLTFTAWTSIDKQNDEFTVQIIQILKNYSDVCLKQNEKDSFSKCATSIFLITKKAIDQNLESAALMGIVELQNLTKNSIEYEYDDITKKIVNDDLRELGSLSAISSRPWLINQSCEGLIDIGILLLHQKKEQFLNTVIIDVYSIFIESIDKRSDDSNTEILNHLMKLAYALAEDNYDHSLELLIISLGLATTYLSSIKQKHLIEYINFNFNQLSKIIIKPTLISSQLAIAESGLLISKKYTEFYQIKQFDSIISIMSEVGQSFAGNGLDKETNQIIFTLKELSKTTLHNEDRENTLLIVEACSDISHTCIEHKIDNSLGVICFTITSITENTINCNLTGIPAGISKTIFKEMFGAENTKLIESFKDIPSIALKLLNNIGNYAITNNNEPLLMSMIVSIGEIGILSAQRERTEFYIPFVLSMYIRTCEKAADKKFENSICEIISIIIDIGKTAKENKLETYFVLSSIVFVYIGSLTLSKGQMKPTNQAADALATFTIIDENSVNKAIQKCSSMEILGNNDSFKKFIELYSNALKNFDELGSD